MKSKWIANTLAIFVALSLCAGGIKQARDQTPQLSRSELIAMSMTT